MPKTPDAAGEAAPSAIATGVLGHLGRAGRWAVFVALPVLIVGAGAFAWWSGAWQDDGAVAIVSAPVQRGDLEDTVTATGTLQPKDYVDVGTQVSGQLKRLLVEVGATVKAGQLLAEIDPSVYQSKVDGDQALLLNQQAQLRDRSAQLELARLQFARQRNLDREGATTTEALQGARAAEQSAVAQADAVRAQIKQTESTLHGDEANLGYTKIHSPIAGTVVSQAAKKGQTLNANQQAPIVMRIADLATMTVQAQVSEADVAKLHLGMDVYFTTLGGDTRRHYGKLRQIPPTPTVVNNVVLYDALFDVENPNRTLMTQMTAQVFFVAASARDALLIPLAALRPPAASATATAAGKGAGRKGGGERTAGADPRSLYADGRALVGVVGSDGKATDREVKIGVMNRVSVEVLAGLEAGEKVVIGTRAPAVAVSAAGSSSLVPAATRTGGRP